MIKGVARTGLVNIEDLSDKELERWHKQFQRLHRVEERQLKEDLDASAE